MKRYSTSFLLIVGLTIAIVAGLSFYLGRATKFAYSPETPPIEEIDPEAENQIKNQEQAERVNSLKSTTDLPPIASASVDWALKNGFRNPNVYFQSNDGEYAQVGLGESTGGGGLSLFLVKRNGAWIELIAGNGVPSCSEVLPLREKYDLRKDFLVCAEELE